MKNGECIDKLSAGEVIRLAGETHPIKAEYFETLDSTNKKAKELAAGGAPERTVVISDAQTEGYGRVGRRYFSPPEAGIYISIILRPRFPAEKFSGITTAAAVAVCRAVEDECKLFPQIKWVNDIYLDGKKVCGILTEGCFSADKPEYAILGIGINVYRPENGYEKSIEGIAGHLCEKREKGLRCRIASAVIKNFFELYPGVPSYSHFEEYKKRMFLTGKTVCVLSGGREKYAEVIGLTENFGLKVRYGDRRTEIHTAGEVSIKL